MIKKSILIVLSLSLMLTAYAQNKHGKSSRYTSYKGLIMAGYQGWHDTPDDGSGRGWGHYLQRGVFGPGNIKIDLWPEEKEYKKLYRTPFLHADSSAAYLPSDHDESTTDIRFRWMKAYGIDGVFMQRFIGNVRQKGIARNHFNKVLGDAMTAAKKYNRAIAVMYDLSGMRDTADIVPFINDWKNLVDSMRITNRGDRQTYLYHNGKPLVVIWGVGFNDGRRYSLQTVSRLVDFLKNDPVYGGCSVMLGVPTYWRDQQKDTDPDPFLHELIGKADIIHPWTVGRYKDQESYADYREQVQKADIAWCSSNKVDYAATVFPGFSWHNLNLKSPFNQIPRDRGRFFWSQLTGAIRNGAEMIYVAMFDEVDEGTAIEKISQTPPVGASSFVTFEKGIPSDYYLYLTGYASGILKKRLSFREDIPQPKNASQSK